jgi:hypothetical protein
VREIQALSKKGISLSTWATHAKKTHTREGEGETRCRQITAAHKVGQTGGGGFDVVQKKLCTTKKRKWPTHTHTSLGRRLGLTFALDQKICVCNLTQVIFEKANNRKKESDFLVDSEKEKVEKRKKQTACDSLNSRSLQNFKIKKRRDQVHRKKKPRDF